jgi:hypothetical protein
MSWSRIFRASGAAVPVVPLAGRVPAVLFPGSVGVLERSLRSLADAIDRERVVGSMPQRDQDWIDSC